MFIEKRGGKFRCQVCVDGKRKSKTYNTEKDARTWGWLLEGDGVLVTGTLHMVLDKYATEITPTHKGSESEISRIKSLKKYLPDLKMEDITHDTLLRWKTDRLKQVSGISVRREMIILRSVFNECRGEWKLMNIGHNPLANIKLPPMTKARKRGIKAFEISEIITKLNTPLKTTNKPPKNGKQLTIMFELGIETGMRLSELLSLTWDRVKEKHVVLFDTKNGEDRNVSLSLKARELINQRRDIDPEKVFTISKHVASQTFRRYRVSDVHFHDGRSEAITRISKKLNVLDLAKTIGHKDLKSLMSYYAPDPDDIADQLG